MLKVYCTQVRTAIVVMTRSRGSRSKFLERWRQTTTQAFSRSAFEQVDIEPTGHLADFELTSVRDQERTKKGQNR